MKLTTENGYRLDEAQSSLIKAMRAGDEELAVFWALEMSGFYPHACWKRLGVFCAEDAPDATIQVVALWHSWSLIYERLDKKKGAWIEEDLLVAAVVRCCRAAKSFEYDALKNLIQERRAAGWRPEVADVALDCHTARGRAMGRTEGDWWRSRPAGQHGKYEEFARQKREDP